MRKGLFTALLFLFSFQCLIAQLKHSDTEIAWDSWGVPHITSDNIEELFFAQGWAQMHNHANLILDLYGSSRGKGAEYWGKNRLQNDLLVHTLGFESLAEEWETKQDPETKLIFESFVNGLNAYALAHPEAIDEKNKQVLPLTMRDTNMHSMFVIFTRFIAGGDLGTVQQWPDLGSNAYAIGPKRSASGNAMLVQNPHLPWGREFLFFESHLNLNGKNMYGSTLVGLPGIALGFNEDLGWSHTNNPIDNADTYELELKDGGYVLDGEVRQFKSLKKVLNIKQEDGTLVQQEFPLLEAAHGPIVKQEGDKALALRMAGLDRPDMLLQWWRMINSTSFSEFESALEMAQIPFWNVMYADRWGEIFYLFNGLVPKRSEDAWTYWDGIISGGKSADIWTEIHAYSDLPMLRNPENGWLQNANDPPWTSTIPMALDPNDYPGYMAPVNMFFRPQRAAKMILEDESITFQELIDYKHSTRIELADRILDDLFLAVEASNSEVAREAMQVLENWDREANVDSKGTLLFYSWAKKFNLWNPSNYVQQWNIKEPYSTPDGLADPGKAVELLEEAALEVKSKFGSLEIPWGEYYKLRFNGKTLPANGIDGSMGVFRVAWPAGADEEHMYVGGGDSWVGVIEFGDEVKAKVLLSYGNATQKDSPHNGDQLELFSKKELRDAWFTKEEVQANTKRVEFLRGNAFVEN